MDAPAPLSVLYRGPLSSCNYGCTYCPFAKRREDRAARDRDRRALERFVAWATHHEEPLSVFFTPWGEALVRSWYRRAIVALSRRPSLRRVAIQTNLSAPLDFLEQADARKVGLWCTYHPEWVALEAFAARVERAQRLGAQVSVGVVGMRDHLEAIEALRARIPASVYVWVNAVKSHGGGERYLPSERARLRAVDPHVETNMQKHPSRGRPCRAGESVIAVDGDGTIRRCHFVPEPLGNLYEPGALARALAPRTCPNERCGCHIGYVHLPELGLDTVYGEGLLERVPAGWAERASNRRLPLIEASAHAPTDR